LKCEVRTMRNGKFVGNNRLHFALNENGNKYKQAAKDGMLIQLNNGKYIIIGSK